MRDHGGEVLAGAPVPAQDLRAFRRLVALVVDDSASQRRLMALLLARWRFDVVEAIDGIEALTLIQSREIDFVVCDWMMPGMTGPEFCRALRRLPLAHYVYVLLVTAKRDKEAVAAGLEAGADDFLSKPPDPGELHARLRAGERILAMQEDLVDKNRRITEAFDRLSALYDSIDRDLRAAARLQASLIPPRQSRCGQVGIGVAWQPAGHVGGDLVGFFPVSGSRLAAYAMDVSGHGISSALMTARLAHHFAPHRPDENLALRRLPGGGHAPRDPAEIAAELNRRLQDEADCDQFFTMIFADLDTGTGLVRFCQAGHPPALVVRRGGAVEPAGDGGSPIGLLPEMEWETCMVRLDPGDRLVLLSDGITECVDAAGEMFEAERLAPLLSRTRTLPEAAQLDCLLAELRAFAGSERFEDDVSGLVLTMP